MPSVPPRSIEDLPLTRQRELVRIQQIIFEEFDTWQRAKLSTKKKRGKILKVILFGSQARGEAVENRVSGYFSDYDVLVVVNQEELTDFELWAEADDRLMREHFMNRIRSTVTLIVHTLQDVNDQLARGRYFWMDVVREGIPLYEAKGHPFIDPQPLSPEIALEEARGYFEEYLPGSRGMMDYVELAIAKKRPKNAAFLLHQAAEQAYAALLLALTLYLPATHNLKRLHKRAVELDPRLYAVWGEGRRPYGRGGRFGKRCFELLKEAYVKARYSRYYRIDEEELALLVARVTELQDVVETICLERLGRPEQAL
jgi:uncharacterized protein